MQPPTLPVHVLTGYLGSGKTTILNVLLQGDALRDAAVVINELGAVGIDHLLVRHVREDVVVLPSGCVCCTLRNDLVEALDALSEARNNASIPAFSRVFVETTGVAEPAPIVQTLVNRPELNARFHLEGLITCVDAELGASTLAAQHEARLQVALADRIVLSKVDRATAAQYAETRERVRALNPSAAIADARHGLLDPQFLLAVGHLDTRRISRAQHVPHSHVQSTAITLDIPVDFRAFSLWVAMFSQLNAPRLLRLKAVVSARGEDHPLAVQAVQHVVYPSFDLPAMPALAGRSHIVLLTQGMDAAELADIESTLRALEH